MKPESDSSSHATHEKPATSSPQTNTPQHDAQTHDAPKQDAKTASPAQPQAQAAPAHKS